MDPKPIMLEVVPFGENLQNCSDPACEQEASVYITENDERKPWCTGHAHVSVACWMVGL